MVYGEDMNKILTIGITTYNSEPYLLELFHSIESNISDENKNYIEIIFSDDYSEDKTVELINEWKKTREDIDIHIYYSDTNTGSPSSARNKMINGAQGKYIMFLDGDDLIIDSLDKIIEQITGDQKYSIDAYVSNVKRYDGGKLSYSPMPHSKELFNAQNFQNVYRHIVYQAGIWWIYSTDFLRQNNIRYDNEIRYEDAIFNFKLLCNNPRVSKCCVNYYGWRVNKNSFSRSNIGNILKNRVIQFEYYKNNMEYMQKGPIKDELKAYIFRIIIGQYLKGNFDISIKDFKIFFDKILSKENKQFLKKIKLKRPVKNNKNIFLTQLLIKNKVTAIVAFFMINKFMYINKNRASIKIKVLSKIFSKIVKVNENTIFMEGFYGEYNDNIKAICDRMIERDLHKKYTINLVLKDTRLNINQHINKINYMNKYKYLYNFYKSKYIFLNTWYNQDILKSKGQIFVQTWHGTPIKKMYTDEAYYNVKYDPMYRKRKEDGVGRWDYILAQNEYNYNHFVHMFPKSEILKTGYPRTDQLVRNKNNIKLKQRLKHKYNINAKMKVVLYMPTFRAYKYTYELNSILKELSDDELLVVRRHPIDKNILNYDEEYESKIIQLTNEYIDTNEVLLLADKLISDYSSVMVDFKQINDNVIFYAPKEDIELYSQTQGLYTKDIQELIESRELIEYSDINSSDLVIDKILGLKLIGEKR